MSCTCGSDEISKKKLQILQKKYELLRQDHKKLAGVAVELTHALENCIRGEGRPNVKKTLNNCSKIYPSLFEKVRTLNGAKLETMEMEMEMEAEKREDMSEDSEKSQECSSDTQKEYYEGFWSRPRIPRTPQLRVSSGR